MERGRTTVKEHDFTKGSISGVILRLAAPLTFAQIVNVLYNLVDKMYIGRMPGDGRMALTGLGVAFPLITLITAFINLCGMGGAPLFSIERGKGDDGEAEMIMGNTCTLLFIAGAVLMAGLYTLKRPLLAAFGASSSIMPYADAYFSLYLAGTPFALVSLGLNSFISSQGYGRTAMLSTLVGACANIALDPLFIYSLKMGVSGAALASILSQLISAAWVLGFLTGKRAQLKLRAKCLALKAERVKRILALGVSSFVFSATNSLVQVAANTTLLKYGGEMYVGVMTVVTSLNEIVMMPVTGLTKAAEPVIGYNYGAGAYSRIRGATRFMTWLTFAYTGLATAALMAFPGAFVRIFNSDAGFVSAAMPALRVYFLGFFMMTFQVSGQTVFVALNMARHAVCFSLLRKAFILVPLVYILPRLFGLGVMGVFWADPVSCLVGGAACFTTMYFTVWKKLLQREDAAF